MFGGILFQIPHEPEPDFSMSSFLVRGFFKEIGNLPGHGRIFSCFASEEIVFHMGLCLSRESGAQIFSVCVPARRDISSKAFSSFMIFPPEQLTLL